MKIFFTKLSFCNLTKQIVPVFLTVTESKFIVWSYSFSGPIGIYFFECNNYNSRTQWIYLKLATETLEKQWRHSSVFVVICEHIWHKTFEQVNAGQNTISETQKLKKAILPNICFRVRYRIPVTCQMKVFVTTVNSLLPLAIIWDRVLDLRCSHRAWITAKMLKGIQGHPLWLGAT